MYRSKVRDCQTSVCKCRYRDVLREQVLRGLGWDIVRIWSTDWWIDPKGTADTIDRKLKGLIEARRGRASNVSESPAVATAGNMTDPLTFRTEDESAGAQRTPLVVTEMGVGNYSRAEHEKDSCVTSKGTAKIFVQANLAAVVGAINPEAFFESSYEPNLSEMIACVINMEGPVLDSVLARRIARTHGWQRTGSRIQARVDLLASKKYKTTTEEVGAFYWPVDKGISDTMFFRRATEAFSRGVDEICMPELVALAREVVDSGKSGEEAVLAMVQELGLQRLRSTNRGRLEKALELALKGLMPGNSL